MATRGRRGRAGEREQRGLATGGSTDSSRAELLNFPHGFREQWNSDVCGVTGDDRPEQQQGNSPINHLLVLTHVSRVEVRMSLFAVAADVTADIVSYCRLWCGEKRMPRDNGV